MRILVTNDDGVESEGIHVLVAALAETEHDVFVGAPASEQSGTGASLGFVAADQRVAVDKVVLPGCEGVDAWAVDGPPGLCVMAARLGAFGFAPDVVVSGINAGLNTGRAILHSGTVGAALTAQNFGLSGLAVSIEWAEPWHWETAARLAVDVLPRLAEAPRRTVLNLNVPSRPFDEVLGIRWARLAPFGAVRAAMASTDEGRLNFELRDSAVVHAPDTDSGLVEAGYAALTTIVGITEAWPPDDGGADRELVEVAVPGAPLEAVHDIPDADDHRTLRRPMGAPADDDA